MISSIYFHNNRFSRIPRWKSLFVIFFIDHPKIHWQKRGLFFITVVSGKPVVDKLASGIRRSGRIPIICIPYSYCIKPKYDVVLMPSYSKKWHHYRTKSSGGSVPTSILNAITGYQVTPYKAPISINYSWYFCGIVLLLATLLFLIPVKSDVSAIPTPIANPLASTSPSLPLKQLLASIKEVLVDYSGYQLYKIYYEGRNGVLQLIIRFPDKKSYSKFIAFLENRCACEITAHKDSISIQLKPIAKNNRRLKSQSTYNSTLIKSLTNLHTLTCPLEFIFLQYQKGYDWHQTRYRCYPPF